MFVFLCKEYIKIDWITCDLHRARDPPHYGILHATAGQQQGVHIVPHLSQAPGPLSAAAVHAAQAVVCSSAKFDPKLHAAELDTSGRTIEKTTPIIITILWPLIEADQQENGAVLSPIVKLGSPPPQVLPSGADQAKNRHIPCVRHVTGEGRTLQRPLRASVSLGRETIW